MYCRKCGKPVSKSMSFCMWCGAAVNLTDSQKTEKEQKTVRQFWKKLTLRTVLIIAGCVAAVCAALIPLLINAGLSDRYNKAFDLKNSGDMAKAKAAFTELGAFKDSSELAQTCQNTIDYDAAKQMMNDGRFDEAKEAFQALGSFQDAAKMVQQCQNTIDYNKAVSLKSGGDLEGARDIFRGLGSFQDAEQMAQECQDEMDYNSAVALMNEGQYEQAKLIFDGLDMFWDSLTLSAQCQVYIDYSAAELAYNNKNYFEAFTLFSQLNGYSDAADRAAACVQKNPENGELYRNPDFKTKSCAVTIKVGNQGDALYLKIFSEDNDLVSTVFVSAGQKTKIKLPNGKYRMKAAYGVQWFGETDMFGNDGYYELLIFEDGTDLYKISSRYVYTLSFLLEAGGNTGGTELSPDGF